MEVARDVDALLRHVDDMLTIENPDATPFASHYQIIENLQRWLATTHDALERALVLAKLGAIYLHVEEPHHAQPVLEEAAAFFFPALVEFAASASDELAKAPTSPQIHSFLSNLPNVRLRTAREVTYALRILDLLLQLGLLWSHRDLPLRALCFFQACAALCQSQLEPPLQDASANDVHMTTSRSDEDEPEPEHDKAVTRRHALLRSVQTHAYFYLAQVYGTLHLADESAQYCLTTLEMQLQILDAESRIHDDQENTAHEHDHSSEAIPGGAMEWIKNALGLVDYYLDTDQAKDAAVCLFACEYVWQTNLAEHVDSVEQEEHAQRCAEVDWAWARVHQSVLQAAELQHEGLLSGTVGTSNEKTHPSRMETLLHQITPDLATLTRLQMQFIPAHQLVTLEDAKAVFKMALRSCEAALGVFVLDGFVTAHVRLRQLENQLYKRLLCFEPDMKRKIAMNLRRLQCLTPLISAELNPQAYTALVQELHYEAAEIAVEIFDLKQQKQQQQQPDAKATTYLFKAVHWYQQYVLLFYSTATGDQRTRADPLAGGQQVELPSSSMGLDDIRGLLHGFFSLARACGKVLIPSDRDKTISFWKQSLEYHEAVIALVKKFQQISANAEPAARLAQLYSAELEICREMIELLPQKINQFYYHGRVL